MAQRYYAHPAAPHLTMSKEQGEVTREVLLENLERMLMMDATPTRERLTAELAQEEINNLSREQYRELQARAEKVLSNPELEEYLQLKGIMLGDPLEELTQVNVQEILDEFSLQEFELTEMPQVEWD